MAKDYDRNGEPVNATFVESSKVAPTGTREVLYSPMHKKCKDLHFETRGYFGNPNVYSLQAMAFQLPR